MSSNYTGPKGRVVSDDLLNDMVRQVEFHRFQGTNTVACALTLDNGFVVVGVSNPLPTTEFDPKKGMEYARADAVNKLAELAGFAVYEVLNDQPLTRLAREAVDKLTLSEGERNAQP